MAWIYVSGLKRNKKQLTKKEVEVVVGKIRELIKTLDLPSAKVGMKG